jgi:hypothetical protein
MWNSPKKGKLGSMSTGQDSESILSVLKGEVPRSTFGVLAALVEKHQILDASTKLQEYEEVALQMASEAFTNVKNRIEAEAGDAQTKLASVESGWAERSAKLETAQAQVAKLKCEIVEAKQDIKISAKAIESARLEVQRTKAADRNGVGNPKLVSEKIRSLEAVEKDVFQPLKQASVKGVQGKNKMKHLQKVGKRFGFHDVLLNTTMPKVALKSIDKRQTFDRLVLDQMEAEFAKKHVELQNTLKDEKSVRLDREAALQTARKSLADAQHRRIASTSCLAEAEKALVLGKQALVTARRDLRNFDKDSQKIIRESKQMETRLGAFLDGPFAAFQKIEISYTCALDKPPSRDMQSTDTRTALTRTLTRIGTMAVPPSPEEMEDVDLIEKHVLGVGKVEQENDTDEEVEETETHMDLENARDGPAEGKDNVDEDQDETEKEEDVLNSAGAPVVFAPP